MCVRVKGFGMSWVFLGSRCDRVLVNAEAINNIAKC